MLKWQVDPTCCCLCLAAACAEVDAAPPAAGGATAAAAVVSIVTLADTSPLAAAAASAPEAAAAASDFEVGTTMTSGAAAATADEVDGFEVELPSPASPPPPLRPSARLAASLIMKAFLGEVNWPCCCAPLEVDGVGSSPAVISLTLLAEDMAPPMERSC